MIFMYLALGIFIVVAGHMLLRFLTTAKPSVIRKTGKYVFYALLIALIFFLLRFGLTHFAAIVGFVSVLLPILQRLRSNAPTAKQPPSFSQSMTKEEARQILDVNERATKKEIISAWKRALQRNHPDQGGSAYLASKINQAKDVLLKD